MRKQRAALEDIADAAAQLHGIEGAHVFALDFDRAAVGLDQPVGEPQQRGLAGAGAADNGEEFAFGDLERDIVDRHHALRAAAGKALADIGVGDQRGRGHIDSTTTSQGCVETVRASG